MKNQLFCNIDIVFVILHYLTISDTIECVESIINKIDTDNYRIIIVDNASANSTGVLLQNKYCRHTHVEVLLNATNLGFARGNNVGFRYARDKYDPRFIAVINNDTMILQNDFFQRVVSEFETSKFALLGPMIFTADGRCDCSPVCDRALTRENIVQRLKEESFRTKLLNMGFPNPRTAVQRCFTILSGKAPHQERKDFIHRRENVTLHGCFMIFGKPYINTFDGLNEETFLYHEEEILYVQLMAKKMKTVYLPTLQVYHKEDSATNALARKKREAKKIAYNYSLESCKVLLRIYDECNSIDGRNG